MGEEIVGKEVRSCRVMGVYLSIKVFLKLLMVKVNEYSEWYFRIYRMFGIDSKGEFEY